MIPPPRPSSCCCSYMITRYIPFTLLAMQTNGHKITATSMCYCLVPSNSNRLLQNPPKSPPSKVANILVCALGCLQSPSTCTVTSASSYLDILLFILRPVAGGHLLPHEKTVEWHSCWAGRNESLFTCGTMTSAYLSWAIVFQFEWSWLVSRSGGQSPLCSEYIYIPT